MDHDANWEIHCVHGVRKSVLKFSAWLNGLIVKTPTWYLCNKYTNYKSYCHVSHNFFRQNLSSLYCITDTRSVCTVQYALTCSVKKQH